MGTERTLPISLVIKLASIVVHAQEFTSSKGHDFDRQALLALANDTEVVAWLSGFEKVLLPVKR